MIGIRYERHDLDHCWVCSRPTPGDARFWIAVGGPRPYRGGLLVDLSRVCEACARYEAAEAEAIQQGRKFCQLDISRCACGRAVPARLSACITCHREARMLEQAEARVRFNARLINTLLREAKRAA